MTPTHLITFGFHPDLDVAAELAGRAVVQHLVEHHGLPFLDAYRLASIAVDLRITQVVNGGREVHEAVALDDRFQYVPVGNEGVGFSLCAGAWLGGRKVALLSESSGLRVATEWIARTGLGTGIPVLMLISHRGDIGDTEHWSDPHRVVCEPLLDALRVPYQVVSETRSAQRAVARAHRLGEATLQPTAVLFTGDIIFGEAG